jgi:hypothetical protein
MAKRNRERKPPVVDDAGPEPAYFDDWYQDNDQDTRVRPRRPKGEVEPRKKLRVRRRRPEIEYF